MIKEIKFKNYDVKIYYREQKNLVMTFKLNYIRISCPLKTSDQEIINFLNKYETKIDSIMPKDNKLYLHLFGEKYEAVLSSNKLSKVVVVSNKILYSNIKSIREFYKEIIEKEINSIINDVLKEIRQFHIYDDLTFKLNYIYAKTFLGRCFYKKGIIEISGYLAKYPKEYYRYILIHEICHFLVPNHSKEFHDLVKVLVPNESDILKQLKKFSQLFNYDYV